MTNEELIQVFPECEKIKREDIAECLNEAMEEKFYSVAIDKVYHRANELWPHKRGPYIENDPEREARSAWFYGSLDSPKAPFRDWMNEVEVEFLSRHGQVHTFDEACQIAADEWMRMIFGFHVQDNGDRTGHSYMAMMMGSLLKDKASGRYGNEVVENARQLMKDYYLGGCVLEDEGRSFSISPYCDYNPNQPLFDVLVKAGVSERDACSICPWKTGIDIDSKDNSVCVRGYQTARYL